MQRWISVVVVALALAGCESGGSFVDRVAGQTGVAATAQLGVTTTTLLVATSTSTATTNTTSRASTTTTVPVSETSASAGGAPTLIEMVVASGVLRVGLVGESELKPFEVAILNEAVTRISELERLDVEWIELTKAQWLASLGTRGSRGAVDVVAGIAHFEARDGSADFSSAYDVDGTAVMVRTDSGIETIEDLEGKRIASIDGTLFHADLAAALSRAGVNAELLALPSVNVSYLSEFDAVVSAWLLRPTFADSLPDDVKLIPIALTIPIAVAAPEGEQRFVDLFSKALESIILDGTWARMYETLRGEPPPFPSEDLLTLTAWSSDAP